MVTTFKNISYFFNAALREFENKILH